MQRIEPNAARQPGGSRRGSIVAYMLVILLVLVAGVVMTTATASAMQAQMSSLQTRRDQAYYAAEAGIQRAFYEVEYGSWQTTMTYPQLTGTVGNSSYVVTATGSGWNSAVAVKSVGTLASDTSVSCAITVTFVPKTLVPAISLGAGISEAGNITIDGNAMIKSNINLKGMIAINGTFIYGGVNNGKTGPEFVWQDPATIPVPPSVYYDPTGTPPPDPSKVVNVTPMVAAGSGAVELSSSSPSTLDFRTASNGVLYYFGDIELNKVDVYGSGTLVVFGNILVKNGGFGDSLDPVNLIATGDIATIAKFRIYGSLYANGDITHQGQFDVTGTVNGQLSMYATNSKLGVGGVTINRAPTPPFDPRVTAGSGSVVFSNFSGPSF
jgi:hypothetical protein